jgi:hypothetical protein
MKPPRGLPVKARDRADVRRETGDARHAFAPPTP